MGCQLLSDEQFRTALSKKDYGYFPYSIEDTFELLKCETTQLQIFRVPIDLVPYYADFVASICVRICGEKYLESLSVKEATPETLKRVLNWLESTDSPESKKYINLATRDITDIEFLHEIDSADPGEELVVGKSKEFYFYVLWFTTG